MDNFRLAPARRETIAAKCQSILLKSPAPQVLAIPPRPPIPRRRALFCVHLPNQPRQSAPLVVTVRIVAHAAMARVVIVVPVLCVMTAAVVATVATAAVAADATKA